ncbi:MAG: SAM-dependent methyltransferase, partial [Cytophagales bacterium]|nr:SAM-dependent methyltransferase [Cytophagales bacterium]
GQLAMATENMKKNGMDHRVSGYPINLLDDTQKFPKGNDAIWMSQFLDCFSEAEIISILKRAAEAIDEHGAVYIMETYWDRQKFEPASFSLQQTSLYFTVIANGNSQMYHSKNMIECVHAAGLYIDSDVDNIGVSHTIFRCKKK